jgi:hypothetical protein
MKKLIFLLIISFSIQNIALSQAEDCVPGNPQWTNGTASYDNDGYMTNNIYSTVDYKFSGTNVIIDWFTLNNTSIGGWISDQLVKDGLISSIAYSLTSGSGTVNFYFETVCRKLVRAYYTRAQT